MTPYTRYDSGDFFNTARTPAPTTRGANFFSGGPSNQVSQLLQAIDIAGGQTTINTGIVTYAVSAYLGGLGGDRASLDVSFLDAAGSVLRTISLSNDADGGLYRAESVGLVPAAARRVAVRLQFERGSGSYNDGAADALSLILRVPSGTRSILGTNLVTNPGAEDGNPLANRGSIANDVSGWSRKGQFESNSYVFTEASAADITVPNRGVALFGGGNAALSEGYQAIDVSAAGGLIDSGGVRYAAAAWLGGWLSHRDNTSFKLQFEDGNGGVLASTDVGSVSVVDRSNRTTWALRSGDGIVPARTRVVVVRLVMTRLDGTYNDGYADNVSFTLNAANTSNLPSVRSSGVLSATGFGGFGAISPGSWIEIYGSNLANQTRTWEGSDFSGNNAPNSLSGVRVLVDDKPAFVSYISPSQVNALVPSTVSTGNTIRLVVSNAQGATEPYLISVSPIQPGLLAPASFLVNGRQYVGALFSDGQTFALPQGAVNGVLSRPARPGDVLTIYGVGFGKVQPDSPAGVLVSGLTTLAEQFQVQFGGVEAQVPFKGLAPGFTGLYQFNVVVPQVADGDAVAISFSAGGTRGTQALFLPIRAQ